MAKAKVTTGISPNGSLSEPGQIFVGDPASGRYRSADGSIHEVIGGAVVGTWSSAGLAANNSQGINVQKISVGFAELVAAGTGVPVLKGTAIPAGAIIKRAYYEVTETFAGDGDDSSLISMGLEDQDNDVLAAVAIKTAGDALDEGLHECIQDGEMANALKLTAARQLAVTLDIAATDTTLEAGAMDVFIEWVQGS